MGEFASGVVGGSIEVKDDIFSSLLLHLIKTLCTVTEVRRTNLGAKIVSEESSLRSDYIFFFGKKRVTYWLQWD